MKKTLTFIGSLIIFAGSLSGQHSDIYELLTESSLSRPLTLHKGFLQFYGSYSHLNGNNYFDDLGTKLPFTESVQSMIENNYRFELSYGILEHLELFTGISIRNRYETLPTYMIDNRPGIGQEDRTYHLSGLSNLELLIKYRLPAFLRGFDMFIYGGINTPVSSQHNKEPTHQIYLEDSGNPSSSYKVEYEFNPAVGTPAIYYAAGGRILYAQKKVGVSINLNIKNPITEVETYDWATRLYGEQFEYWKLWYYTKPKGILYGGIHLELQPFPWFAVNAGYDFYRETHGWSDLSGQKVSLTTSSGGFINAGFEIQVSTNLRLLQFVNIPVKGKSTYSEFSFSLGAVYTIVPLKNIYY